MAAQILGAPIKRREDPEYLQGKAKYTADIDLPGMAHMAFLHSSHAHAKIKSIDTSAAAAMPGVIRVFTAADIEGKIMRLPVIWKPAGFESRYPPHPYGLPGAQTVLATDRVRWIGDQLAVVVAETRRQAYDACAAIKVEYEPLPVVVDARAALQEGAPQLHDEAPGNLNAHIFYGDKAAAEQAIADAEVVIKKRLRFQRVMHQPIENRASIGHYDPETGEYTLWTNTQIPHGNRFLISQLVLGIPYNKLRVIAPHIGGAFGSKGYLYSDAPLILLLSREVGRPIKWVDTRHGISRTTVQARGQDQDVTLAGKKDGSITALSVTNYAALGAYSATNGPGAPSALTGRSVTGAYAIPHPFYEVYTAYTNTTLVGPIRGAGRSEALYMIERMVDLFAHEIGMDPAEVRRKNLVRSEQFPYDNGLGWTYDSGDYQAAFDKALAMIAYEDLAARKAEARQRGKRLGVGIGTYVAVAGVGPSPRMGLQEGLIGSTWGSAHLRIHQTGDVTVITGSQPHGQGHVTTFSQIIAQELGVPMERVEVLHSDSKGVPYAQGSYGSRTYSVEGATIYKACQAIKAKACTVGAYMLGVSAEEVEFAEGKVQVKDAPDKAKSLAEVALALWYAWDLPPGVDPGLEVITYFDPPEFNFPFGTHVALVEVDEQTGQVDVVRYVAVDDFGNVGNPLVVDGQCHGNIALGISQALLEEVIYDDNGQIVNATLYDYPIARATQLPTFELDRTVTPTTVNPLGAKGAGDVTNPAVAPAIVNAVCDALSDLGVRHIDMPLTPEKVWRAMHQQEM